MNNRIEFIHLFSYWIIVWFIIYYIYYMIFNNNNKMSMIVNPIPVLIMGIIENVIMLIIMIISYKPISSIILYLIMIICMKLVPLYLLQNRPILWFKSILFTSIVFLIYNLYLIYNQTSIYEVYKKTMNSLLQGKYDTPGYNLIHQLMNKICIFLGIYLPRTNNIYHHYES